MSSTRSAPINFIAQAGVAILIFKRISSTDTAQVPTVAQAGLTSLIGFRFTDRLSWDQWVNMMASSPGLLFGSAYVVALPSNLGVANIMARINAGTYSLDTYRVFMDSATELTNLLGTCNGQNSGSYVGGVYDPETAAGLVGAATPLVWP